MTKSSLGGLNNKCLSLIVQEAGKSKVPADPVFDERGVWGQCDDYVMRV